MSGSRRRFTLVVQILFDVSALPVRRTLQKIGIPHATFYRWYDLYQSGGPEALDDRTHHRHRFTWLRHPIAIGRAESRYGMAAEVYGHIPASESVNSSDHSPNTHRRKGRKRAEVEARRRAELLMAARRPRRNDAMLEAFAQELAMGKNAPEAARAFGYSGSSLADNAKKRSRLPSVRARVAELRALAAEKCVLTVEQLIGESDRRPAGERIDQNQCRIEPARHQ
jgi:hypothetical protein